MRWLSILVVALALVASGCGGGDDDSAASDETTAEETLTESTTDEATTEDSGTDADADFNFADEDCQSLVAAFLGVSQAFAAAAGGSDAELQEQADAFSEFADDVPDEIRADVETLASAYGQYVDVLQDAGIQPGQIPTSKQAQQLTEALESVGTANVTAASERLSAWTTENCS